MDDSVSVIDEIKRFKILIIILCVAIFLVVLGLVFSYSMIASYNNKVYPNIFLENYNLSNINIDELSKKIDSYSNQILNSKFKIECNNKEYEYTYKDLGLTVDSKKLVETIFNYQNDLSYSDKILSIGNRIKKSFNYSFIYDEESIVNFVNNFKMVVDTLPVDGHLVMNENRELSYVPKVDSFSLNTDSAVSLIKKSIDNGFKDNVVKLEGIVVEAQDNELYRSIDTKVSSFSTEFDPYIIRATNLETGLAYIDGAIIQPGEVFSFYKYAGPYNKKGYVFYYEFVGNGVCQIASTVYNAALLGGLEIVRRYPHEVKSVYVPGGLDATVASYANGWNVDFQFRNTYNYPIYISAYAIDGVAHVDFWSNSNAKEGKTYQTESVQIGTRGYETYLHTYQNGVEINKSKIATTWYTKD